MIQVDSYGLFTLLSAVAFAILGLELCFRRIPSNEEFSKLNLGRQLLASTYILLAFIATLEYVFHDVYRQEETIFFTVSAAGYQSILLFSVLLTCFNPAFTVRRRLILWLGITSVWVFLCGAGFLLGGADWMVYLELCLYLFQLGYSSVMFINCYRDSIAVIEASDKNKKVHFRWIKFSFIAIVILSILTAVFAWMPSLVHNVFSIICIIFYVWLSANFSNYAGRVFHDYYPVLTEAGLTDTEPKTVDGYREHEERCREKVDAWVARKGFHYPDPDRDSAAEKIGLDKEELQWYFSVCLKEEFRAWRVKLRIEDAKDTLMSNPDCPVNELARSLGFISKTNFYAHFKRIVGETTSEFVARHHS